MSIVSLSLRREEGLATTITGRLRLGDVARQPEMDSGDRLQSKQSAVRVSAKRWMGLHSLHSILLVTLECVAAQPASCPGPQSTPTAFRTISLSSVRRAPARARMAMLRIVADARTASAAGSAPASLRLCHVPRGNGPRNRCRSYGVRSSHRLRDSRTWRHARGRSGLYELRSGTNRYAVVRVRRRGVSRLRQFADAQLFPADRLLPCRHRRSRRARCKTRRRSRCRCDLPDA
jgi:hypothetical protein